jgi:hypothetical protein
MVVHRVTIAAKDRREGLAIVAYRFRYSGGACSGAWGALNGTYRKKGFARFRCLMNFSAFPPARKVE